MREIKFRGYAIEKMVNSQWLYGFGVMPIDYADGTVEYHLHTFNGTYEVVPRSIGQYTGLKDKKGKEIYEGDIYKYIIQVHYGAKYSEFECKDVVRYENGAFWVGDHLLIDALENDDEAEIIGNIFDNPDLVGESNV